MSADGWVACAERLPPYALPVLVKDAEGAHGVAVRSFTDETGEHWYGWSWAEIEKLLASYGSTLAKHAVSVSYWRELP